MGSNLGTDSRYDQHQSWLLLGSGGGSVGWAVLVKPELRGLNPDISKILSTNCTIEKAKIKKMRPGMAHLWEKLVVTDVRCCLSSNFSTKAVTTKTNSAYKVIWRSPVQTPDFFLMGLEKERYRVQVSCWWADEGTNHPKHPKPFTMFSNRDEISIVKKIGVLFLHKNDKCGIFIFIGPAITWETKICYFLIIVFKNE